MKYLIKRGWYNPKDDISVIEDESIYQAVIGKNFELYLLQLGVNLDMLSTTDNIIHKSLRFYQSLS